MLGSRLDVARMANEAVDVYSRVMMSTNGP